MRNMHYGCMVGFSMLRYPGQVNLRVVDTYDFVGRGVLENLL
jgi:hypothetical protein